MFSYSLNITSTCQRLQPGIVDASDVASWPDLVSRALDSFPVALLRAELALIRAQSWQQAQEEGVEESVLEVSSDSD